MFDEVKIKEDLVYDKYNSTIIGFVSVGHINNHLLAFELQQQKSSSSEKSRAYAATHMLVFMVRGIFSDLKFPYGQFSCSSLWRCSVLNSVGMC